MNKLLFILVTASALCFSCTDQTADLEENSAIFEENSTIVEESQYKGVGSIDPYKTKRLMIFFGNRFISTVNPPEPDMSWISKGIKMPDEPTPLNQYNSMGLVFISFGGNSEFIYNSDYDESLGNDITIDVFSTGTMSADGQITSLKSIIDPGLRKLKPYPLFQTIEQIPVYNNMITYMRIFEENLNGENTTFLDAYMLYLDNIHKAKTGWTVQEWLDET